MADPRARAHNLESLQLVPIPNAHTGVRHRLRLRYPAREEFYSRTERRVRRTAIIGTRSRVGEHRGEPTSSIHRPDVTGSPAVSAESEPYQQLFRYGALWRQPVGARRFLRYRRRCAKRLQPYQEPVAP